MANENLGLALLQAAAQINPYSRDRIGNLAGAVASGVGAYRQGQSQQQEQQALSQIGGSGADRYRQLADYWADKDPAKAKQYFELAQSSAPQKPKAFGQSVVINGRLVQLTESGQPVDLGPAPVEPAKAPVTRTIKRGRDEVTQEWDGMKWVDIAIAPRELGGSGGGGQLVQTIDPATGKPRFERVGAGMLPQGTPILPGTDFGFEPIQAGPFTLDNPKSTDGQRRVFGYVDRMTNAEQELQKITGGEPTLQTQAIGALPIIGDFAKRKKQTTEQQNYETLAMEWIRAKLRKESGAVIGEREMRQEIETYFPQPGDTPERLIQKAALRAQAINSTAKEAGARGAYIPKTLPGASAQPSGRRVETLPPASQLPGRIATDEKTGRKFRSNGKTWEPL